VYLECRQRLGLPSETVEESMSCPRKRSRCGCSTISDSSSPTSSTYRPTARSTSIGSSRCHRHQTLQTPRLAASKGLLPGLGEWQATHKPTGSPAGATRAWIDASRRAARKRLHVDRPRGPLREGVRVSGDRQPLRQQFAQPRDTHRHVLHSRLRRTRPPQLGRAQPHERVRARPTVSLPRANAGDRAHEPRVSESRGPSSGRRSGAARS
jgi:hypothetical protein